MKLSLRYDMRAPALGAAAPDLYAAALDQVAWAEQQGWDNVRISEHHGTNDGYLPSPLTFAAALAAVTERMLIRIAIVVLPFHEAFRVAEDAVVVDLVSCGRLELVVGAGYAPYEFSLFGQRLEERGAVMEQRTAELRALLRGETIEVRGVPFTLRPLPSRGRLEVLLAGTTTGAARRAARVADGFDPVNPALFAVYDAECRALGKEPGVRGRVQVGGQYAYFADDVDQALATVSPYICHEVNTYGEMIGLTPGDHFPEGFFGAEPGDSLPYPLTDLAPYRLGRGGVLVCTPDEGVDLVAGMDRPDVELRLHPLVGGMPPDLAWSSLQLFADEVVPELVRRGVVELAGRSRTTQGTAPPEPAP